MKKFDSRKDCWMKEDSGVLADESPHSMATKAGADFLVGFWTFIKLATGEITKGSALPVGIN